MNHPPISCLVPRARAPVLPVLLLALAGCREPEGIRRYRVPKEASGPAPRLTYRVPEGWSSGPLVVSRGGVQVRRDAAFEVARDGQRVEITVTSLPAAAGSLPANLNRWRQQMQLEPISEEEVSQQARKVPVGDTQGDYVQIFGPDQAILGVVVPRNDTAWFVKLQGDRALAAREKARFEAFVASLHFKP